MACSYDNKEVSGCFYSKLVRLEVMTTYNIHELLTMFLFQTGAIRSVAYIKRLSVQRQFLFQTGAIRRQLVIGEEVKDKPFLFQTGAIRSVYQLHKNHVWIMFLFQTGAIRRE